MRIAAITMVQDEPTFLPLWISHYGALLGPENLYVLDHGSIDRSKRIEGCNHVRLPRTPLDEQGRADAISHFHASLLSYYDAALYTDVDEFVVVDPISGCSIADLMADSARKTIAAVGLNVVHLRASEAPLDVRRPIFEQRRWVRFDPYYVKVVASAVPIRWRPGFHGTAEPWTLRGNLYLFHLRAADWTIFVRRHERRRAVSFSDRTAAAGLSNHFTFEIGKAASLYFFDDEATVARDDVREFDFTGACRRWMSSGDTMTPRDWPTAQVPERLRGAIAGLRASM